MTTPPPIPLHQRVRNTDPVTSRIAAAKAARSGDYVTWVLDIMQDGVPRIDQEIEEANLAAGRVGSDTSIRQARLALSRAWLLVPTGRTKNTKDGSPSREWVISPDCIAEKVLVKVKEPLTRMVVHVRYLDDKIEVGHDVFEGEVPVSQQPDNYKQLIGDGKASVTSSIDVGESDYGNGGKVFVSVTLTVDQSQQGIESGIAWAKHIATQKAWEAHAELKEQLKQRGILR